MRASQFITEQIDSDATNELDTYIMNNEELYRRRFMPIIANIKRKLKKGIYDHDKAQKLWMYLVDDGAKEFVKAEYPNEDVADRFPKETRLHLASIMAQRELDNIKQGEYPDAPKGTVS